MIATLRMNHLPKLELSAIMKKLKDNEDESSSKISDLTTQINNMLAVISSLHAQKNELENDLLSSQKTKEELELYCKKIKEEHA